MNTRPNPRDHASRDGSLLQADVFRYEYQRKPLAQRVLRNVGLLLWVCVAIAQAMPALGQGALTNGGRHEGTLAAAGEADDWSLTAQAGDTLLLRIGTTGFTPRLQVFDPANTLIATVSSGNANGRDDQLTVPAASGGTYRIAVDAKFAGQKGDYDLHAAHLPGDLVVSPGDEGGDLPNGVAQIAQLTLGDLDLWRFTASAGDALFLRAGSTNFTPWLRLYGPSGELVAEALAGNANGRDDFLTVAAPAAGAYTLVITAKYANQSGSYGVHLARYPGDFATAADDEGGVLANGVAQIARLPLGDLDLWKFTANAGDGLVLRVGSTNFTPWLRLYGPDGALVGEAANGNANGRDDFLTLSATQAGTYLLVASAKYGNQAGSYGVHLARLPAEFVVSPGDEGGELPNGVAQVAQLPLGDLDLWRFTASAGDALFLRAGSTNFTPWLRLYGPSGELVTEVAAGNANARDNFLTVEAPSAGAYTLVISATYANQSGSYGIHLARYPGDFATAADDEGGVLSNGVAQMAGLPLGDLDLWKFTASAGDGLMVRVGSTNFTPWLRLYGPDGDLVGEVANGNANGRDDVLTLSATQAGTYLLVVSAKYENQAGSYAVHLAQSPGEFEIAAGDEGGPLRNGATNLASLNLGDLDSWSFVGTPGDSNVFRLNATGFTPWMRLFGPDGSVVKETTTGNANARNGILTFVVTNSGPYHLVVSATYLGQSGSYALKQSRVAPDLVMPDRVTIHETETLAVSITSEDPDEPGKPLTFELLSAPAGLVLNPAGATNATLTWATGEADGPSTNLIVARVTDVVNGTEFHRTNRFTVVVNEVNLPPQLTVPGTQTVDELTPMNVVARASDTDLPSNSLTYSLLNPPAGMTIDPSTGVMAWVPTEAQGPGNFTVTVVVTDENPPAVNAVHLSATNSFAVTVREVNLPPTLRPVSDQPGDELATLSFLVASEDPDLPANGRTYGLVSAPAGMVIDPATGAITWTPTEIQGPSTNVVRVRVQDTGIPALSATNQIVVIVGEVNGAPQVVLPGQQAIDELAPLAVTAASTDPDLPGNTATFSLVSAPPGVSIDPVTGALSWIPTEAQGPSTNDIVVRVQDDGIPPLAGTNTLRVVVGEINTAPVLTDVPVQTTRDDTVLRLFVKAADPDLPANSIRYSLGGGAPAAATMDPATGELAWNIGVVVAAEPGTIVVRATDDGIPPLSDEMTITVNIVPPTLRLMPIADQVVDEQSLFSLTVAVTNSPQAQPPYTFALDGVVPAGASVNPTTGVLFWRPTEAQGPSTNLVTVKVSDSATPPNATNQVFRVIVQEVNLPPVVAAIAPQSTVPGGLLTVSVLASDEDLPANRFSYFLEPGAPAGMTIQESSGVLTWSPPESAAGTTNEVTVRVADDGQPSLGASRTFRVVVARPAGQVLQIEMLEGDGVQLRMTGTVGQTYLIEHSPDLRTWNLLTNFVSTTASTLIRDVGPLPADPRYYRAIAP